MRISGFGLLCVGALFALTASTGRAGTCSTSCSTSGSTTTCTSTDAIKTPDEGANGSLYTANIYPSCITVPSSVTGTVANIQVQLTNVDSNGSGNYFSAQGTEILLMSPTSAQLELLGGPGNGSDTMTGLTMLIGNGSGFNPMPNGNPAGFPASGTQDYEPSAYEQGYGGFFPSPGPGSVQNFPQTDGTATLTSVFAANGGVTAAGTWNLYMIDNFGDPVTVNGWKLILTVNASEVGTTTTVTSNQQPAYTGAPNNAVTFTATVTASGSPVTAGTVAFYANGSGTPIACSSGNQTLNGSGQATCGTTLTAGSTAQCTSSSLPAWPTVCQGNNVIVATYSGSGSYTGSSSTDLYQLVTAHATSSGTQWCNSGPFSVPAGATPLAYPSIINVSGYSNTVANVTVALTGVAGQQDGIPGQFLLVAPDGTHNLDFLDEAFFANGATSAVNLTFFDTAGQTPAGLPPTSGNYEAYDANPNPQDTFPASVSPSVDASVPQVPGIINYAQPRGGTGIVNFGEAFRGVQANGDWALYAYTSESLTVNGGWCITFTLNNGAVSTTSLISSQPRATTGQAVTFTATVTSGGSPVTSGTVTFEDNGLTPAGTVGGDNVLAVNGSGRATFTTAALAEGDHNMMANYSGVSGTYDPSSNSLYQREDNATSVSNVTSRGAQFCNTGGVTSPQRALGAFSPNPSNIFVSNLWGTVSGVTVTLDSFDIPDSDANGFFGLESLLVGPQAALDFFSVLDGSGNVSTGNYIFADTGSTLSTSNIAPGTYKPASDDSSADTFFQDPGNFYALPGSFQYAATHGSATLTSVFGSSVPNGTWSLYFNQTENSTTGATAGWCLNFTENPVTVTATTESTDSFTQGQQGAQFTVNIKNNGTGPTGDPTGGSNPLTVTDTLNAAFSFVSSNSTGWNCGVSGQTVTCTNDSAIAQGSSYPALTLTVNVSPSATPAQVSNTFNVTGGAGVTATSSNTDTVTILPAPKLAVQKTHPGTFKQGATAEWDISVTNTASGGATSGTVTVSDTLPAGYTVANFGTTSSSWTCGGTTTVTCTSTLAVSGGSGFPLIEVIVNVPANSPTSVSNTALAWGGGDLTHTNSGNAASGTDSNVPVVQTPASISASGGSGQNANVNTAFAQPLQATVLDGGNKPIQGVTVTFTAPGTGPSGTFPGGFLTATAGTNGSGVATSPAFTANSTAGGPYTVAATVSGLSASAGFALTNNATTISATVNTSPTGLSFTVDTTTYTTAQTFTWVIGSMHTIATTSPQPTTPGTHYVWEGWTDGGAISHTVTAPSSNITYTASFNVAYQLTLAVSPAGTGSIQPNSGMFFPPGFMVDLEASPNAGFAFNNWTGPVANPNNASTHVTVNAPTTVTANFVVSGAASLSGRIASKSGTQNSRVWTIKIANSGPGGAVGAQLNGITLKQSFGTACTPLISTPFPLSLGVIAPGGSASGNVLINFTGCPFNARFTVDIPFSANGGAASGSIVRYNQFQ